MKNAITRTLDDPVLEEMPVVPTDHIAAQIQPDSEPCRKRSAAATEESDGMQESSMELGVGELSRKTARNALLPNLDSTAFTRAPDTAVLPIQLTWQARKVNAPEAWPERSKTPSTIRRPNTRWGSS